MLKRIMLIILVSALAFSFTPGSAAAYFEDRQVYDRRFADVLPGDWYYSNVVRSFEMGIVNGVSGTAFSPGGTVTTVQAVVLSARLRSLYYNGTEEFPVGEAWYTGAVEYAIERGIVSNTIWKYLHEDITRAKFFQLLSDALPDELLTAVNPLPDSPLSQWNKLPLGLFADLDADSIYAPAVYRLYQAGIITGDDRGIRLGDTITRGETAALLTRIADESLRVIV